MAIVAVFGSSRAVPHDALYRDSLLLGRLLAEAGFSVANGGYAGVMEAVSAGARGAGGAVIGVTAPEVFPGRRGANAYLTSEVPTATISERIHRLVDLADASVSMPGNLGTFTELMVSWNDGFVAPFRGATPKPHVVVGQTWRRLVNVVGAEIGADTAFVECVDDVAQAVEVVARRLASSDRLQRSE